MRLIWTLETFSRSDIPDVLVVAAILFVASLILRGPQATPLLRGTIVVVLVLGLLTTMLDWVAFRWLLGYVVTGVVVAIPVVFQSELRRALERVGRTGWSSFFGRTPTFSEDEQIIEAICAAAARLSERRHGALIVLERNDCLDEFINTGVPLDSQVSPQLFLTVFWPKTELHDGAVIIRRDRAASAASVLPLSSGRNLTDRKLGTRHRAGLGISEVSDALCVIVSEETGRISVTNRGRMIRRLDADRLRTILSAFYISSRTQAESWPWTPVVSQVRRQWGRVRKGGAGRRAASM
jgi:diadenylate cyclase